jgi:hypothetical protein
MARPKKEKTKKKIYRTPWSELLRYVFTYEVNYCDHCRSKLILFATIKSEQACHKILSHLNLPIELFTAIAPRAPPELDFFNQAAGNF